MRMPLAALIIGTTLVGIGNAQAAAGGSQCATPTPAKAIYRFSQSETSDVKTDSDIFAVKGPMAVTFDTKILDGANSATFDLTIETQGSNGSQELTSDNIDSGEKAPNGTVIAQEVDCAKGCYFTIEAANLSLGWQS